MRHAFAFEEATIGILTAVLYADGVVADEELAWWRRVQARHPLFADFPPALFNPILARAQQTLLATPWQDAIDAWAREVPHAHAELVYCLAVALQLADGDCARKESRITAHLSHALRIPPERSTHLFEAALERLGD